MDKVKTVKAIVKFKDLTLHRLVRKGCEDGFKKFMDDLFGDSCDVIFVYDGE